MKKLIALLLCLTLLFTCAAAYAVEQTTQGIGTFTLPDGYEVDTTSFADQSTDTNVWLFNAYSGDVSLECYNDYLEEYAGESLFSYTEDEMNAYIEDAVSAFSNGDFAASFVETVRAGQIPFSIFVLEDENGRYYYAETIASGWCISVAFYNDDGTLPQEQLPVLEGILTSFVPAA